MQAMKPLVVVLLLCIVALILCWGVPAYAQGSSTIVSESLTSFVDSVTREIHTVNNVEFQCGNSLAEDSLPPPLTVTSNHDSRDVFLVCHRPTVVYDSVLAGWVYPETKLFQSVIQTVANPSEEGDQFAGAYYQTMSEAGLELSASARRRRRRRARRLLSTSSSSTPSSATTTATGWGSTDVVVPNGATKADVGDQLDNSVTTSQQKADANKKPVNGDASSTDAIFGGSRYSRGTDTSGLPIWQRETRVIQAGYAVGLIAGDIPIIGSITRGFWRGIVGLGGGGGSLADVFNALRSFATSMGQWAKGVQKFEEQSLELHRQDSLRISQNTKLINMTQMQVRSLQDATQDLQNSVRSTNNALGMFIAQSEKINQAVNDRFVDIADAFSQFRDEVITNSENLFRAVMANMELLAGATSQIQNVTFHQTSENQQSILQLGRQMRALVTQIMDMQSQRQARLNLAQAYWSMADEAAASGHTLYVMNGQQTPSSTMPVSKLKGLIGTFTIIGAYKAGQIAPCFVDGEFTSCHILREHRVSLWCNLDYASRYMNPIMGWADILADIGTEECDPDDVFSLFGSSKCRCWAEISTPFECPANNYRFMNATYINATGTTKVTLDEFTCSIQGVPTSISRPQGEPASPTVVYSLPQLQRFLEDVVCGGQEAMAGTQLDTDQFFRLGSSNLHRIWQLRQDPTRCSSSFHDLVAEQNDSEGPTILFGLMQLIQLSFRQLWAEKLVKFDQDLVGQIPFGVRIETEMIPVSTNKDKMVTRRDKISVLGVKGRMIPVYIQRPRTVHRNISLVSTYFTQSSSVPRLDDASQFALPGAHIRVGHMACATDPTVLQMITSDSPVEFECGMGSHQEDGSPRYCSCGIPAPNNESITVSAHTYDIPQALLLVSNDTRTQHGRITYLMAPPHFQGWQDLLEDGNPSGLQYPLGQWLLDHRTNRFDPTTVPSASTYRAPTLDPASAAASYQGPRCTQSGFVAGGGWCDTLELYRWDVTKYSTCRSGQNTCLVPRTWSYTHSFLLQYDTITQRINDGCPGVAVTEDASGSAQVVLSNADAVSTIDFDVDISVPANALCSESFQVSLGPSQTAVHVVPQCSAPNGTFADALMSITTVSLPGAGPAGVRLCSETPFGLGSQQLQTLDSSVTVRVIDAEDRSRAKMMQIVFVLSELLKQQRFQYQDFIGNVISKIHNARFNATLAFAGTTAAIDNILDRLKDDLKLNNFTDGQDALRKAQAQADAAAIAINASRSINREFDIQMQEAADQANRSRILLNQLNQTVAENARLNQKVQEDVAALQAAIDAWFAAQGGDCSFSLPLLGCLDWLIEILKMIAIVILVILCLYCCGPPIIRMCKDMTQAATERRQRDNRSSWRRRRRSDPESSIEMEQASLLPKQAPLAAAPAVSNLSLSDVDNDKEKVSGSLFGPVQRVTNSVIFGRDDVDI